MTNAKASSYIDRILQSGIKLLPFESKFLEEIKGRVFRNKNLSGSQSEFLL